MLNKVLEKVKLDSPLYNPHVTCGKQECLDLGPRQGWFQFQQRAVELRTQFAHTQAPEWRMQVLLSFLIRLPPEFAPFLGSLLLTSLI